MPNGQPQSSDKMGTRGHQNRQLGHQFVQFGHRYALNTQTSRMGIERVDRQRQGVQTMSVSEKRHRTKLLGVRLLPDEHEALRVIADKQGVSMSELVVNSLRQAVPDVIGAAQR